MSLSFTIAAEILGMPTPRTLCDRIESVIQDGIERDRTSREIAVEIMDLVNAHPETNKKET